MKLTVTLPLPPTTNTLYATVQGRRVLSAAGRAYHKEAGWLVKEAAMKLPWRTRPDQRYRLELVLHFPDRRRADISNRIKVLEDAAAAALGFNDTRVDELFVRRGETDKAAPRAELSIEVLT